MFGEALQTIHLRDCPYDKEADEYWHTMPKTPFKVPPYQFIAAADTPPPLAGYGVAKYLMTKVSEEADKVTYCSEDHKIFFGLYVTVQILAKTI